MSAIAASARILRSSTALQTAARRSYSAATSASQQSQSSAATQGYSDRVLYTAAGVSGVLGFDIGYVYYNYGPGSKSTNTSA